MTEPAAHPIGSDEWLSRVFQARVRDRIFRSHAPYPDDPVLVLLGGQPAAGKTQAQLSTTREY